MITILKRINDLEIQVKADLQKARGAKHMLHDDSDNRSVASRQVDGSGNFLGFSQNQDPDSSFNSRQQSRAQAQGSSQAPRRRNSQLGAMLRSNLVQRVSLLSD